jgi:hypothetical protein
MRFRALTIILLAMGCGIGATMAVSQMEDKPQQASAVMGGAPLFVAAISIEPGEPLTPHNLRIETRPVDRIPDGAVQRLADVRQRFALQRLLPGEPVLKGHLADSAFPAAEVALPIEPALEAVKALASAELPEGGALPVAHAQGHSNFPPFVVKVSMSVHPADAAQLEPPRGEPFSPPTAEQPRSPEPVTRTLPAADEERSLTHEFWPSGHTSSPSDLRLMPDDWDESFSTEVSRPSETHDTRLDPVFPTLPAAE